MTGEGRRSAAAARTRTPIISPPARPRSRTWQASRGQLHSTTTSQLATGDWRPWPVRWRTTARADGGGGDACARPSDPASHADGLTGAFPTSAALETDIASERIEPIASTSQLEDEVVLPSSGRTLRNRLIKVRRAPRFQPLDLRLAKQADPGSESLRLQLSMAEELAHYGGAMDLPAFERLYNAWAEGGWAMVITGAPLPLSPIRTSRPTGMTQAEFSLLRPRRQRPRRPSVQQPPVGPSTALRPDAATGCADRLG
jgi:hypothetical protein